ncbi:hypothetical protein ACP70R_038735 [Stipagrostis hirtigluma subsp. patula]
MSPPPSAPYGSRRPWASLPQDLVEQIGWRVLAGDLLDYVRLRAVCAHWKSSTVGPRGRGLVDPRFHPRRWMMLPEGHGLYPGHPSLGGYVRFFNLSTGAFARVHLPIFDDHIVLDSTDGLLLLHGDHDAAIRLLNPFTGDIAELPSLVSVLPQMDEEPCYRHLMEKTSRLGEPSVFLDGVCAAVSIDAAGAVTVMLSLCRFHHVAHATVGDQRWTLAAWKLPRFTRAASFRGKLYGASMTFNNKKLHINQIDPPQPNAEGLSRPQEMFKCPLVGLINLVECGSELMIVGFSDTTYSRLVVYRVADLMSSRVIPVTSIGDHVLLLYERGVCVSPLTRASLSLWATLSSAYMINRVSWGTAAMSGNTILVVAPGLQPLMETFYAKTTPHQALACSSIIFTHVASADIEKNKGFLFCASIIPDWSVKPNLQIKG